ncbi:MAG: hypothetical protein QXF56_03840 [Candidatus Micrarchaeia archaeon]
MSVKLKEEEGIPVVLEPFSKAVKKIDEKQTLAEITHSLVKITDLNNNLLISNERRKKELQKIASELKLSAKKVGTPEFQRDIELLSEHLKESNPLLKSFVSGNLESIQLFLRRRGYFFEAFPIESKDGYVKFAYAHGEENEKLREVANEAGVKVTKRVFNIYGTNSPSSYFAIIPHLLRKDEHELYILIHQNEIDEVKGRMNHVKEVSEGGAINREKLFTGHFFTDGYDVLPKQIYTKLDSQLLKDGLKNLFASNKEYDEAKVIKFANKIRETTGHDDRMLEVKLLTLRMLFQASQKYNFASQESINLFRDAFTQMHKVHEERHSKNNAWKIKLSASDDEKLAYLEMMQGSKLKQDGIPFLALSINLMGFANSMEEKTPKVVHPSIQESQHYIECHKKAGYEIVLEMAKQAAEIYGIKGYPEKYLTDGDKKTILALGRLDETEIKKLAIQLESSFLQTKF